MNGKKSPEGSSASGAAAADSPKAPQKKSTDGPGRGLPHLSNGTSISGNSSSNSSDVNSTSNRSDVNSSNSSSNNCGLPACTDVVIVGAGPTGLTLALCLALHGVPFVVVDAASRVHSESRALAVQARSLEIFEDLGVASSFLLLGLPLRTVEMWLNGQRIASIPIKSADAETTSMRLPQLKSLAAYARGFGGAAAAAAEEQEGTAACSSSTPFPFSLIVPEATTCRILEHRLNSLGHKVHRSVAVWQVQGFATDEPTAFPPIHQQQQQQQESGPEVSSQEVSNGSSFFSPHEIPKDGSPAPEQQQQQQQKQQQQKQRQQKQQQQQQQPMSRAFVTGGETPRQNDLNNLLGYPVAVHFGWYLPSGAGAVAAAAADATAAAADSPPVRFGVIRCKYIVGCDGARSVVRKAAAISFEGHTSPSTFMVADVQLTPSLSLSSRSSDGSFSPANLACLADAAATPAGAAGLEEGPPLSPSARGTAAADQLSLQQQQQFLQRHRQEEDYCSFMGCNGSGLPSNGTCVEGFLSGLSSRLHAAAAAAFEPGEAERGRRMAAIRTAASGNALEIHLTPKGFAACIPLLPPCTEEDIAAAALSSSRGTNNATVQAMLLRRSSRPADSASFRWRVVLERNAEVAAAAVRAAHLPANPAAAVAVAVAADADATDDKSQTPLPPVSGHDSHAGLREELLQQIERVFTGCRISEVFWFSVFHVAARMASAVRRKRLLLAGDAAHVHPPAFGQGMNLGIQDAYNLSWKLARVLRGEAAPQLLDTYAEESASAARQVVRLTDNTFKMVLSASSSSSGVMARLLLRIAAPLAVQLPGVTKQIAQTVLMTHLAYPYPSVALGHADASFMSKLKPGCRAPDCLVKVARIPRVSAGEMADPGAGYLFELLGKGRHLLLLHVMLLPPGSRKKNVFGCEIAGAPLVLRYNIEAVSTLARLCQLAVLAASKSGVDASGVGRSASSPAFVLADARGASAAAVPAVAHANLAAPFSAADFADAPPVHATSSGGGPAASAKGQTDAETAEDSAGEGDVSDSSEASERGQEEEGCEDAVGPLTPAAAAGRMRRWHTSAQGSDAAAAAAGALRQLWATDLRVVWCIHGQPAAVHTTSTSTSITSEIVRGNSRFVPPSAKPRAFFLSQQHDMKGRPHAAAAAAPNSSSKWDADECHFVQRPLLQLVPPALLQQMQQASSSSSKGTGGFVLLDFLGDLQSKFGLIFADPHASNGAEASGGFSLIRPDGVLAQCGRAGDSKAARGLLDYLIRF